MKVNIASASTIKNYQGTNEKGNTMSFSGDGTGVSPMEAVLMSSAACSAIDVELILHKMRQPLQHIAVDAESTRATTDPKVFTGIHLHYTITGDVKAEKVAKAIEMSMTQFCSVSIMLARACPISTSYTIIKSDNE
jgi:putative redox protein